MMLPGWEINYNGNHRETTIKTPNGQTYPVYNEEGSKFLGVKPDGHTPVYSNDPMFKSNTKPEAFSPFLNDGIYASVHHTHSSNPLDYLPDVMR